MLFRMEARVEGMFDEKEAEPKGVKANPNPCRVDKGVSRRMETPLG
jgi:hypothetical protein